MTTSTSFELASSHARATSIKFTKQQLVSEWVSYWQAFPMIGLGSDKNITTGSVMMNYKHQKHKSTNSTKVLRRRSDISIYKSKRTKSKYKYQYLGICIWEEEREKVYLVGREPNSRPAPLKTRSHESSSLTFCSEMLNRVIWIFQETGFHISNSLLTPGMSLL